MHSTLIASPALNSLLGTEGVRVVDCRFDLSDVVAGRKAYLAAHIPGAVYADLDNDLSGPPTTDHGRHPLPPVERMIEVFSRLGIRTTDQVVAYDGADGMIAARLWWMLRYLGHAAVAVLDGGWQAWHASGFATEAGEFVPVTAGFNGQPRSSLLVTLDEVPAITNLVDAREPRRYRGEFEPLDRRAGHIPGARNHFFRDNLDQHGRFLTRDELRRAFAAALGTLPDGNTVHYCGSGVSACHNVLAQVHAGMDEPRLYCGSWSEWCADDNRQCATGDEAAHDGQAREDETR